AASWLGAPWNAAMAILLAGALFWHARLGLQVVIEDYVHHRGVEVGLQVAVAAAALLGAVIAVLAILKVALTTA
ncbi:MAG: succinate dehydrogenase, hydrophobic membrane anchor protein, partial [Wenzhouxiangellaceae bacterium]